MANYHLSWDSFKRNICNGFSQLQQKDEFVDMTLAAEGHFVKVHKTLVALASPYLKEVLQTAPCQHPVIFLTHISHDILGYIIEYVYTGEVVVPSHKMDDFIEAAKALHIVGVKNLIPPAKFKNISRDQTLQGLETDISDFQDNPRLNLPYKNTETGLKTPVNVGFYDYSTDQEDNLMSHVNSDDFIENTRTQKLASQNFESVAHGGGYSSQFEKFVNPTTSSLSATIPIIKLKPGNSDVSSIDQTKKLYASTDNTVSEVITHEVDDPGIVPADNNMCYNSMADNMDIQGQDNMTYAEIGPTKSPNASEAPACKDYSINVEMPNGNTGPPIITIQASVTDNATGDYNQEITTQSNVATNSIVRNSIPKITINAGTIQDVQSISISRDSCPVGVDKSTESLIGSKGATPLYMTSNRGSIQMILNRYIYGIHHQSEREGRKRWRCIDYRHKRCPAYVDTLGEKIVSRKFVHNHRFHDDKIVSKGSRKPVFESLDNGTKMSSLKNLDYSP